MLATRNHLVLFGKLMKTTIWLSKSTGEAKTVFVYVCKWAYPLQFATQLIFSAFSGNSFQPLMSRSVACTYRCYVYGNMVSITLSRPLPDNKEGWKSISKSGKETWRTKKKPTTRQKSPIHFAILTFSLSPRVDFQFIGKKAFKKVTAVGGKIRRKKRLRAVL